MKPQDPLLCPQQPITEHKYNNNNNNNNNNYYYYYLEADQ
jgi:hypothetical protein